MASAQHPTAGHPVTAALARLQRLLPLADRLREQAPAARRVHRLILCSFARDGRPPEVSSLIAQMGPSEWNNARAGLANADLIVLGPEDEVQGAYPFTVVQTDHLLQLNGAQVYAMCALDALAVAPMFDCPVSIDSQCAMTRTPIAVSQRGGTLVSAQPERDIRVGIGWREPEGCAATSLCREMVFLRDWDTAQAWRTVQPDARSLYDLDQAIALGTRFFLPLLTVTS